jgi:hypothetical protein
MAMWKEFDINREFGWDIVVMHNTKKIVHF